MQLKLKIIGNGTPIINHALFKYNKEVAFMSSFDDSNLPQLGLAYPIFQGGVGMNGVTYPGLKYSDGTGKMINFRGMLVMVAGDVQDNSNPTYHTWLQAATAVLNHWRISNHTAYQDRDQSSGFGPHPWDSAKNLLDAEAIIWDKLGYRPIINTAPADDEGYMYTGKELGYICHSSNTYENNFDVVIFDKGTPAKLDLFMSVEPTRWFNLVRENFGDGAPDAVSKNKQYIDEIFNRANTSAEGSNRWFGNWFTHGPQADKAADFLEIHQYILSHPSNTGGERAWVPSVAEFLEYFHVKKDTEITQTLVGDTLTLDINQDNVNPLIRNRDLSLLLTGVTIDSVISSEGFDDVTFSISKGLINLYKTDGSFAPPPNTRTLAAQIIKVIANNTTAVIYYDKPVTQSDIEGYTISGRNITNIIGSGKVWTLLCDGVVSPANKLTYRMYGGTNTRKGNAITVGSGLNVYEYINYPISPEGTIPPETITVTPIKGRNFITI